MPREFRSFQKEISDSMKDSVRFAARAYFTGYGNSREIVADNEDADFQTREKRYFSLQDYFRKRDNVYEGVFVYPEERVWKKAVQLKDNRGMNFYGTPVASAMYKLAGDGNLSASWKVEVDREGEYEIFVYVYRVKVFGNHKEIVRTRGKEDDLTCRQYYTIKNGDNEYDASTETNDKWKRILEQDNWYSLGKFQLKPGMVEVVLWDKGEEEDQVIVADAVKFVLVEE